MPFSDAASCTGVFFHLLIDFQHITRVVSYASQQPSLNMKCNV